MKFGALGVVYDSFIPLFVYRGVSKKDSFKTRRAPVKNATRSFVVTLQVANINPGEHFIICIA